MDTAYVINLKHRTDRWEKVQEDFKDAPFKLERYDAIKIGDPPHFATKGTYALFYTHQKIIQEAKERGDKTLLIMEDDALPCKDYGRRWILVKEYLDTHLNEWDVFNGGVYDSLQFLENPRSIVDEQAPVVIFNAIRGAAGQFLYFNIDAISEKVKNWEDYKGFECDAYYVMKHRTIACVPFIAIQHDGDSDIENQPREWVNKFKLEEMFLKMKLNQLIRRK